MFFSVVIPVYNRPEEIRELLESLTKQTYDHFEVLIIEDGSEEDCEAIAESFADELDIRYFYKENSGQGFSRNYGFERANGDYYVVFDSDCLIPEHYFETVSVHLSTHNIDAWGGPDKAHPSFSTLQKAISYSMTSPFTTGGIRGNKRHAGTFHPRSFNMGISKEVFEKTGGYKITRMGEDIEFSLRIIDHGFITGLIPDAYVYHKRRTSIKAFFKQLHFFGRARVNISRFFPDEVKFVHLLPSFFTLGLLVFISLPFWNLTLFKIGAIFLTVFALLIGTDSTFKNKNPFVGLLSILTSIIQLTAYGIGFMNEWLTKTFE
ncbi:MAG: glycosyltransferase [Balneolaceae bacterium]|nr:glycosyltransferase [Balneolaceae bacterium]